MKEQVGVDERKEFLKEIAKNEPAALLRLALVGHHAVVQEALENLIADYERLKRLDENVKTLTVHKKSLYESVCTHQPDNLNRQEELFLQIEELESLDK